MQEVKTFKQSELVLKVNRAYNTNLLDLSVWKPYLKIRFVKTQALLVQTKPSPPGISVLRIYTQCMKIQDLQLMTVFYIRVKTHLF